MPTRCIYNTKTLEVYHIWDATLYPDAEISPDMGEAKSLAYFTIDVEFETVLKSLTPPTPPDPKSWILTPDLTAIIKNPLYKGSWNKSELTQKCKELETRVAALENP